MSALRLTTATRSARATALKNTIDAGSGAGKIEFYAGSLPATVNTAISGQTLLATCELSDPCGTVTDGVLMFSTVSDDVAIDATGTIAFGLIVDSDGNVVGDGMAGVAGSGAAFIFNTVSAVAGGICRLTSAAITEGNG